jgi:ADP-ribose pyrophosphatase
VLELPAGKLEPGEDPKLCALRELEEETGMRPGELHYMGCSYSSPGIFTEKIHLFFARNLQQGEAHPDEGEFLDVLRIPLKQLLSMVGKNQICDAKTIVGLMKGTLHLRADVF